MPDIPLAKGHARRIVDGYLADIAFTETETIIRVSKERLQPQHPAVRVRVDFENTPARVEPQEN